MPSSKACAFPKEMNPPEDFVLGIHNRFFFFKKKNDALFGTFLYKLDEERCFLFAAAWQGPAPCVLRPPCTQRSTLGKLLGLQVEKENP